MDKMELDKKSPKLTDEDIDDIMCSALEGGVTYWCQRVIVVGEFRGEFASDQISREGSLMLYDRISGERFELTKEKFVEGFNKWYAEGGDFYDAVQADGNIDCGMIDAGRADAIVQYALFGETVYG